MHSSVMLGKEILAIKVIVDLLVRWRMGVIIRIAGTYVATIETKLKMLDGDMSLPFVL